MITNFAVYPGDDIEVQIVAYSGTVGAAYITDETSQQSVAISFDAPAGTQLVGNSAEWIVERPSLSSGLANLMNYVTEFIDDTITMTTGNVAIWGGTGASENPDYSVTMLDDSGNPISVPVVRTSPYNANLVLHDEGSAR